MSETLSALHRPLLTRRLCPHSLAAKVSAERLHEYLAHDRQGKVKENRAISNQRQADRLKIENPQQRRHVGEKKRAPSRDRWAQDFSPVAVQYAKPVRLAARWIDTHLCPWSQLRIERFRVVIERVAAHALLLAAAADRNLVHGRCA